MGLTWYRDRRWLGGEGDEKARAVVERTTLTTTAKERNGRADAKVIDASINPFNLRRAPRAAGAAPASICRQASGG